MPQSTDLSRAPWFDDTLTSANAADYQAILFKPTLPVQTRELNGLQAILRRQVEKFGDSVYRSGTVIEGCSLTFHDTYPYAKIRDLTVDGLGALPANYVGLVGTGASANVRALVVNWADGFESTVPDLKTLYLRYTNSGADSNTHSFVPGEVVTLADPTYPVASVNVASSGVGFSNSDTIQFTSAVAVNVSTGTFTNGSYVTISATGSNLQIVAIDSTTLAGVGQVILSLQPRDADLANASLTSDAWAVANNTPIRNSANTAAGTILSVIGSGASAALVTDAAGRVSLVTPTAGGAGYTTAPNVRIRSPGNLTGLAGLSLVAQTWAAKVTIANTVDAVGNGYAVSVDSGTIYQKGLFLQVDPQTVVVDRYDTTPNAVSVGFTTLEAIVDSDLDPSLLDNSAGFLNDTAPGADRLRFTPTLVVGPDPVTDNTFLPIARFSEGNPYVVQSLPAYSKIGDEMARRTYEEAGNFVLDKFAATTRTPANGTAASVSVIVDPGTAYVRGYRVQTLRNYAFDVDAGVDTLALANQSVSLAYGNYLRINNLGGLFQFNTGDVVTLYDTAKQFLANTALSGSANAQPVGNVVGTARVRSLTYKGGTPGDANAHYRLYLFQITPANGHNITEARSVFYSGAAANGIADVIVQTDPTTGANVALVQNVALDSLIFRLPQAMVSAANVSYAYRTIDQALTFANSGVLTKSITGSGETFAYPAGALSSNNLAELIVFPTGNNLIASANIAGTVAVNTTVATVTGTGTNFVTDLVPGDWVQVWSNSTVNEFRRVVGVTNSSVATLDSNSAFTQAGCALYRAFPRLVPIPFGTRSGLTGNVSANLQVLNLSLGMALQGSASTNAALAVDIQRTAASPRAKQADRNKFVKISLANNAGGLVGPWCVGVPDVIRLGHVYLGSNSSVDTTYPDVTSEFYLDVNHTEEFADLSFLFKRPGSGISLNANSWLLVQLDALTTTGTGYASIQSYESSNLASRELVDSTPLANLGANIASLEVPEVFTGRGQYYDLADSLDFRVIAANTATLAANASSAPVNPTYSTAFGNTANPANELKFPLPDSTLTLDVKRALARYDSVVVGSDGYVTVVRGKPGADLTRMRPGLVPGSSMRVATFYVPPYPTVPEHMSVARAQVANTGIACEVFAQARIKSRVARDVTKSFVVERRQPTRYTQGDIGKLDRRIQALEYYASLSALETDITKRVVPSSVTPTVSRFKFGIQADDFSTAVTQDVANPAYAAEIDDDKQHAPTIRWYLRHGLGRVITPPWTEVVVAEQDAATTNPTIIIPTPLPNTPTPAVANAWLLRIDHDVTAPDRIETAVVVDTARVTMASVAGPASLWFHVPPTSPASGVVDPDEFKIYQGSTLLLQADLNAAALTSADQTRLKSPTVPADWFGSTTFAPLAAGGGFVSGSGKIQWTHDPTKGRQYTIVSTRQTIYDHWRWALEYPIDPPPTPAPISVGGVLTYRGVAECQPSTMVLMFAGQVDPASTGTDFRTGVISGIQSAEVASQVYNTMQMQLDALATENIGSGPVDSTLIDQAFRVTVRGLKPSTKHSASLASTDEGPNCRPLGGNIGDPLVSDSTGTLVFDWFYSPNDQSQPPAGSIPITPTTLATELVTYSYQPVADGTLSLSVSAPGSTASLTIPVVADQALITHIGGSSGGDNSTSGFGNGR